MKVSELTGKELDKWVAMAQPSEDKRFAVTAGLFTLGIPPQSYCDGDPYTPTTNWQQCGELIERFELIVWPSDDSEWSASVMPLSDKDYFGSTPQEAICRAVVASVYGDTVPDKGE
jgi:hypothetical protein